MKKILFICPYPQNLVASQRFRFEQYRDLLEKNGFDISTEPFFDEKAYYAFYQSGNLLSKIYSVVVSYFKRLLLLFHLRPFEFIFIHREATPLGPPIIEYVIAKVLKKKIIYDFDDAIWLTDKTNESLLTTALAWRAKVRSICRWSHRISCGNAYLAAYALRHNTNIFINPTTIDPQIHVPLSRDERSTETVTVGWTGSRSTLKYLEDIVPALQALERRYPQLRFIVIAEQRPLLPLRQLTFVPWRAQTEIADLATIDIGLMPLPDDPWTRGKCGFKALQYMAMGIPAVVSPVGVNREIVEHGVNGYCCTSFAEWFDFIVDLITHPLKRKEMGIRGREKLLEAYSTSANTANFLSLFE